MDWFQQPDGKTIYWLCGMAGSGKSTIARTIAQELKLKKQLGASFIFKRGHAGRGNTDQLIPTIVTMLCNRIPAMRMPLAETLLKDSLISTKSLQDQFDALFLNPLQSVSPAQLPIDPIALVIDALDECEGRQVKRFLDLLASVGLVTNIRLRIIVTSRPETPIETGFKNIAGQLHDDVILEEVQASSIADDIKKYLIHELGTIRAESYDDSIPPEWPSSQAIDSLVVRSIPLFIYAATVCRFVRETFPQKRLEGILNQKSTVSSIRLDEDYTHLRLIYAQILQQVVGQSSDSDSDDEEDATQTFRRVIGSIILAADPLSARSLARLLQLSIEEVNDATRRLKAVLNVPLDSSQPIQTLHLSFREFLVDTKNKANGKFRIDEKQVHTELASECIRVLMEEGTLRQDICNVKEPGFKRLSLTREQISESIPSGVAYACMYWPHHLVESGQTMLDDDPFHRFLTTHFTHWLEAMSWLGKYNIIVSSIHQLIDITKSNSNSKVSLFLEDARRFVFKFRTAIDIAPLQVYHCGLKFAPIRSVISQAFKSETPDLWSLFPDVAQSWNPDFLILEAGPGMEREIAFSPDGRLLACSAIQDETVWLWSLKGEELCRLRTEIDIVKMEFCFDGTQLAILTCDGQVQFHDVVTGSALWSFQTFWSSELGEGGLGQGGPGVRFPALAAISTQGRIAFALHGRLWVCDSKGEKQLLIAAEELPIITAFTNKSVNVSNSDSPDDSVIERSADDLVDHCSSTDDEFGKKCHGVSTLDSHIEPHSRETVAEISSIAFSSDGALAAGTSEGHLIFWNDPIQLATPPQILRTPARQTKSIAFRADGREFATTGYLEEKGVIYIWTRSRLAVSCRWAWPLSSALDLEFPYAQTLALGPNGSVAFTNCSTIVVLDPVMNVILQRMSGYGTDIWDLKFLQEGQLASCEWDGPVRFWSGPSTARLKEIGETHKQYRTVRSYAISTLGGILVSSHMRENVVRTWNLLTGKELGLLSGHEDLVNVVAISTDGKVVASGSDDCTIRVWDPETANELRCFRAHSQGVRGVAVSPDGRSIASIALRNDDSSRDDCSLILWRTDTGKVLGQFSVEGKFPRLAFSSDGKLLAACHEHDDTGYVHLYDPYTGEFLRSFDSFWSSPYLQHEFAVDCNKYLACADRDNWPVQLWDIAAEQLTLELFADDSAPAPKTFEFSSDGRSLHTNAGTFDLSNLSAGSKPTIQIPPLRLNNAGDWVQHCGVDVLWLPPEYRQRGISFPGHALIMPTSSNGMLMFRLKT